MFETFGGLLLEDRCLGCVAQYLPFDGRIVLQPGENVERGPRFVKSLLLLLMFCKIALSLTYGILFPASFSLFLLGLCELLLGLANVGVDGPIFVDIEELDDGFFLVALLEGVHEAHLLLATYMTDDRALSHALSLKLNDVLTHLFYGYSCCLLQQIALFDGFYGVNEGFGE